MWRSHSMKWGSYVRSIFSDCLSEIYLIIGATTTVSGGRDSSVGISTGYGLDGPGIESRWEARFFAHVQTGPEAHPASCTMGTGCFPGVKRPGRGADHHPLLAPRSGKSRAIPLPPSGPSGLLRGTFTSYDSKWFTPLEYMRFYYDSMWDSPVLHYRYQYDSPWVTHVLYNWCHYDIESILDSVTRVSMWVTPGLCNRCHLRQCVCHSSVVKAVPLRQYVSQSCAPLPVPPRQLVGHSSAR
jgi:hypothetical protein